MSTEAAVPPLPVADPWFSVQDASDDIARLSEPHLDVLLRANLWFVHGRDRDLLVDTGNGIAPLGPVVQALQRTPGAEVVAVATHAHGDHAGGLHAFAVRAAHPADAPAIAAPDGEPWLLSSGYDDAFRAAVEIDGYTLPPVLVDAVPDAAFDVAAHTIRPAIITRPLEEGDVLDLGDRAFEVLHLPGHTPGGIGLWEEATGVLFSGDTVYAEDDLLDETPGASIADYVASMRRLASLPVRVVHGGHDSSFGRERLRERCDEYVARRAGVAAREA